MVMDVKALEAALAKLERYEAAEEQVHIDRLVALRVKLELVERAEREQADLRRSEMTPAEKSAFIRANGKARYDEIPW